jgi:hypothetical protein
MYSVKWAEMKRYRCSTLTPDNTANSKTHTAIKVTKQRCSKPLQEVADLHPICVPREKGVKLNMILKQNNRIETGYSKPYS